MTVQNNPIISSENFDRIMRIVLVVPVYFPMIMVLMKNHRLLNRCNTIAKGEVLDLLPRKTTKGIRYDLCVQFIAEGKTITVIDDYGEYSPISVKRGDIVDVLYDPSNPKKSFLIGGKEGIRISNWIVACVFLFVTLVVVIYTILS